MAKSTIVIVFEEPITFEAILLSIQDFYKGVPKIKVYAAVNEAAESIIGIIHEPKEKADGNTGTGT